MVLLQDPKKYKMRENNSALWVATKICPGTSNVPALHSHTASSGGPLGLSTGSLTLTRGAWLQLFFTIWILHLAWFQNQCHMALCLQHCPVLLAYDVFWLPWLLWTIATSVSVLTLRNPSCCSRAEQDASPQWCRSLSFSRFCNTCLKAVLLWNFLCWINQSITFKSNFMQSLQTPAEWTSTQVLTSLVPSRVLVPVGIILSWFRMHCLRFSSKHKNGPLSSAYVIQ